MIEYKSQIIQTLVVLSILIVGKVIFNTSINRIYLKLKLKSQRKKVILKIVNLFLFIVCGLSIAAIWGLDKSQLVLFITSVVTVLGIAFFAQWSILANITSGLILYFNHPLNFGDTIKIIDKDFPIEGIIEDISFFFLHIKTKDGEHITIPNSVILQKTISVGNNNK